MTRHNQGGHTPVTVLGLGMMGAALANAFLRNGHPTTVWNRTAGKADGLVSQGATRAATVADAVSASPLVVICVTTYAGAREILDQAGHGVQGKTLVALNTGTPRDAAATATWAAEHGADYLDGAIMNVPQAIGDPETLLLYSGSEAAFGAYRPILTELGGDAHHLGGDPSLAKLYEMAVGGMLMPALVGFLHGAALLGTAKAEAKTLIPFTTKWLQMVIDLLPDMAREVDAGEYATDVSALGLYQEAIVHEIEVSEEAGVDTGWLRPLKTLIDRGVAAGHGGDSFTSVIELLRKPV
ncbi:NAD(P)-dependent oxidoreductase [Amycolatopsis nigrescens]|uniref:NAD(P)-dependent oxidoreductase n=1 Tax=Amycolatopsis nigrescens TaxID=381445 RepID=UPI0003660129|nr:NAD(P)-binding domain-containing protein [Amycolatopsis nigrescens]AUD39537.1 WHU imine reductase 53 [synthetic construct]